jgi:N4-gp56 family major capsid protein
MAFAVSGDYYGAGSGVDSYGSAAATKFIPEIWSGKLAVKFYASTCLGDITNNDWEGEIKDAGDKVQIRSIPTITIRDYQKGLTLTNEVPTSTPIELLIDKGKYFSFVADDVDKVQADVRLMDMFSQDAAEQMKITIEQTVFNAVYDDAASGNYGATAGVRSSSVNLGAVGAPLQLTKTNVLEWIVDMGLVLDEQNVPETGRWVILPPYIASLIKKSDLKDASLAGDGTSILRNGRLGMIDRFTLYTNNNLHTATDLGSGNATGGTGAAADNAVWDVMAGTRDAVSFASQFVKMETLRSTSTFGDIVRGLNVFGFKTTKPEALVWSRVMK